MRRKLLAAFCLLLFSTLIVGCFLNVETAKAEEAYGPLFPPEVSNVSTIGKNATLEVSKDYIRISNDLIGAEISLSNPSQVRYFDGYFTRVLVYMEQMFVERFNAKTEKWSQVCNQAYEVTYTKTYDGYDVKTTCTDTYSGLKFEVHHIIRNSGPLKIKADILNTVAEAQTVRVVWSLDGILDVKETVMDNGATLVYGEDSERFDVKISFKDVVDVFGPNIAVLQSSTSARGKKRDVTFGSWSMMGAGAALSLDPYVVGTSTVRGATKEPFQRKTFYANGRFWLFYSNGTNMVYSSSSNGVDWTTAASIRAATSGEMFSVWFDGTYLHYAYAASSSLYYRRGTPNSDGSITWSATEQTVSTTYNSANYPFVSVDSNGYVWIAYIDSTYYYPYVIKSGNNDGTWGTTPSGFPYQLSDTGSSGSRASIIPLTSQKMLAVYSPGGGTVKFKSWSGSAWNSEVASTSQIMYGYEHSVVAVSDNAHVVFLEWSTYDILHVEYFYSNNSLSSEHTVQSAATLYSGPVLSRKTDSGKLYCFWAGSPSTHHIYYKTSENDGVTWSSVTDWINESTEQLTRDSLTCFKEPYGVYLGLAYTTKTSSPYNVKYAYMNLNNAPTIGGFQAPTTVYANKYFYLNATINDADGAADFVNATVKLSTLTYGESFILKWDNATDVFSEFEDPNGYCTLDSANSYRTVLNSTAYKLSWKIKLDWRFPEKWVSVDSNYTIVYDIYGGNGNSHYHLFIFEDDLTLYSATVEDSVVTPGQTLRFGGILYYEGTTAVPEDTSGITAKVSLGNDVKGSTTTIDNDGSFTVSFSAERTVGSYEYIVYGETDETTNTKAIVVKVEEETGGTIGGGGGGGGAPPSTPTSQVPTVPAMPIPEVPQVPTEYVPPLIDLTMLGAMVIVITVLFSLAYKYVGRRNRDIWRARNKARARKVKWRKR